MSATIRSTAVVGAGAVGCFFGAMLARAGHPVTLIGRPTHVQAIHARGLVLRMAGRDEAVHLAASTELEAVRGADLVLFCVKSTDSEATARALAPLLADGAIVASLQNGVDNVDAIARHVRQRVVPTVVYVATAMPEPGVVAHFGRGDLVIGPRDPATADAALDAGLQAIVELFGTAGVPVKRSDEVMAELWSKLLVNCAYNAISALVQTPYGRMVAMPEIRELQRAVVHEVIAVAAAEGIRLPTQSSMAAMERIAVAMPAQLSSTAQDLARGKRTEIDHLNGHVARLGQRHGVATPANQALHALVKLAEAVRGTTGG